MFNKQLFKPRTTLWEFYQNQGTDGKDGQILNHNLVFLHKRCQIKFCPYLVYVTKGHGSRPTVVLTISPSDPFVC